MRRCSHLKTTFCLQYVWFCLLSIKHTQIWIASGIFKWQAVSYAMFSFSGTMTFSAQSWYIYCSVFIMNYRCRLWSLQDNYWQHAATSGISLRVVVNTDSHKHILRAKTFFFSKLLQKIRRLYDRLDKGCTMCVCLCVCVCSCVRQHVHASILSKHYLHAEMSVCLCISLSVYIQGRLG